MTKVYRFDADNGAYVSERDAKLREDGSPILPETGHGSMTGVVPPEPKEGFMRVFDREAQSWSYQENHNGKTIYDKATGASVVLRVGKNRYPKFGPIPDGCTTKKPTSPFDKFDERSGEWVEDAAAKRAATVPASITSHQMLMGLLDAEMITEKEALDASRTGAVPATIQAIFDALPTARGRIDAAIRWAKMSLVERNHPLVSALAAANKMSEDDVDAFFVACAKN